MNEEIKPVEGQEQVVEQTPQPVEYTPVQLKAIEQGWTY